MAWQKTVMPAKAGIQSLAKSLKFLDYLLRGSMIKYFQLVIKAHGYPPSRV
jgi:hypothetical protein